MDSPNAFLNACFLHAQKGDEGSLHQSLLSRNINSLLLLLPLLLQRDKIDKRMFPLISFLFLSVSLFFFFILFFQQKKKNQIENKRKLKCIPLNKEATKVRLARQTQLGLSRRPGPLSFTLVTLDGPKQNKDEANLLDQTNAWPLCSIRILFDFSEIAHEIWWSKRPTLEASLPLSALSVKCAYLSSQ